MTSKHFFCGFFALLFFSAASCTAQRAQKLDSHDLTLEGQNGRVSIKTEIARTDEERSIGLMYRKQLADGQGMLFVFDRDDMLSFWMKNTLIPLSIAFISSDGRIVEIKDMVPGSLDPVRASRSVRYALEVPQGWFVRAGIAVGDRLLPEGSWR